MKKKNLLLIAILATPFCCLADAPKAEVLPVEIGITFLPTIFFLIILFITTLKLRNSNVKLADFLAEKGTSEGGVNAAQPGTQSVSRLIAFLTGLVALVMAICLTVFFIYCYFKNNTPADLSKLSDVIWGLGIGVIPYGFNKTSTALNKTQ